MKTSNCTSLSPKAKQDLPAQIFHGVLAYLDSCLGVTDLHVEKRKKISKCVVNVHVPVN